MGLSNRVQAVLVGVSAGLGAFGTAAAVIPDFVPVEYKVPIVVTSWLAGIVGFSIKEASRWSCSRYYLAQHNGYSSDSLSWAQWRAQPQLTAFFTRIAAPIDVGLGNHPLSSVTSSAPHLSTSFHAKKSSNTAARTLGLTPCVWPASVRSCALGMASLIA